MESPVLSNLLKQLAKHNPGFIVHGVFVPKNAVEAWLKRQVERAMSKDKP